jgi:hypothetical protein
MTKVVLLMRAEIDLDNPEDRTFLYFCRKGAKHSITVPITKDFSDTLDRVIIAKMRL